MLLVGEKADLVPVVSSTSSPAVSSSSSKSRDLRSLRRDLMPGADFPANDFPLVPASCRFGIGLGLGSGWGWGWDRVGVDQVWVGLYQTDLGLMGWGLDGSGWVRHGNGMECALDCGVPWHSMVRCGIWCGTIQCGTTCVVHMV